MSLKFNQHCVIQKNINALSIHAHKSLFQGISLQRSAFLSSRLCVWVGVKGIRTVLVTMVIRALLAWLDCQERVKKGGERGRVMIK